MKKTLRMLELAKEIVHLENETAMKRQEFARLAQEPEFVEDEPSAQAQAETVDRPGLARTSPLPQRVLAALDMASRPLTPHEIVALLGQSASVDSVRAALSKLIRRGTVDRFAPNLYVSKFGGGHKRAAGEDS